MAKIAQNPSLSSDLPLLGHLLVLLAVLAAFGIGLAWLLKPTVIANPALAAYAPPPATVLIPPEPKAQSPELAAREPAGWASLAQAYDAAPEPPKPEEHPPVRKRPRAVAPEPGNAWAWGGNREPWNNRQRSDGWNDRSRYSNQSNDRQRGSWSW